MPLRRLALPLALCLAGPLAAGVEPAPPAPRHDGESWTARSGDGFAAATRDVAPQAGDSLVLVRCAGLYRSIRLRAGRAALGDDRWKTAARAEARLTEAAAALRQARDGVTAASARAAAEADVAAIARLYLSRAGRMAAATGLPWSTDPLWTGDAAACHVIARPGAP